MPIDPKWLQSWLERGALYRLSTGDLLLASQGSGGFPARFYAPDFFLNAPAWVDYPSTQVIAPSALALQLNELNGEALSWKAADRAGFERDFNELQTELRAGKLEKAVPVIFQTAEARITAEHRARWIANALRFVAERPVTLYGLWDSEQGILGATPETLFELRSPHELATMALAGTRRNGEQRISLLEDPKERREHQLVIDWIRERLAPLGAVRVGETRIQDLGPISHLKTSIELTAQAPLEFTRLVEILHPTPALGGAPQELARAWLKRSDERAAIRRGRFGAPFGVLWENRASAAVAIRNLQWKAGEVVLGAGCGVILESELEREWAELQGKIASVKKIFGEEK